MLHRLSCRSTKINTRIGYKLALDAVARKKKEGIIQIAARAPSFNETLNISFLKRNSATQLSKATHLLFGTTECSIMGLGAAIKLMSVT